MSLHQLAQHMQRAGRGDDKMLVHMTPGEVHGLQALAMASGGSLTINPHTGLPEAGWLSKLLPSIAGAVLAPFTGGLSAALIVGGASALASGSLKQGLLAGIGAFGGAGLTSGLASAGAGTAANAAGAGAGAAGAGAAEAATAASQIGQTYGTIAPAAAGAGAGAAGTQALTMPGVVGANQATLASAAQGAGQQAADQTAQQMIARHAAAQAGAPATATATEMAQGAQGTSPTSWWDKMNAKPDMDAVGRGYEKYSAMDKPISSFVQKNAPATFAAAAPVLFADQKVPKQDMGHIRPWTFERQQIPSYESEVPFNSTAERRYFNDVWTPEPIYKAGKTPGAASGGIVALATGGYYGIPQPPRRDGTSTSTPTGNVTTTTTVPVRQTKEQKAQAAYEANRYSYDPNTQTYTKLSTMSATPGTTGGAPATATPTAASPVQIANMYDYMLKRPPTMDELKTAMGSGVGTDALKSQIYGSDEYLTNLTKPFVPRTTYDANTNRFAVEGALKPYQSPAEQLGLTDFYSKMNSALGSQLDRAMGMADGGVAYGDLGGYSDGGRLLRGPGDGVSDSIPAVIGSKQPARLADGEFVVPARIVSELGNGSTEAGARKLYAMMDRVQKARRHSVGHDKVAVDSKADKHLPA